MVGDKYDNRTRDSLLFEDLREWAIQKEDWTHELRWFIASRQVCRNFYLRARGHRHSHLTNLERFMI